MNPHVFILIITILLSGCSIHFCSESDTALDYRLLESRYERGRESNNIYLMASAQLAMEQIPIDSVFGKIRSELLARPESCKEFLEEEVRRQSYFYTNIVAEANPAAWDDVIALCEQELSSQTLDRIRAPILSNISLEDSEMDRALILKLDTIRYLDQYYRAVKSKRFLHNNWSLQEATDRENLESVRGIISSEGYPSSFVVSARHKNTIWLVLHHQSDCNTRRSYRHVLAAAVNDNYLSASQLKLYDERTARLCD